MFGKKKEKYSSLRIIKKDKMKFGSAFREYLQEEREWLVDQKCAHVEYIRLKKVLKTCQKDTSSSDNKDQLCHCQSCPCKSFFFYFLFETIKMKPSSFNYYFGMVLGHEVLIFMPFFPTCMLLCSWDQSGDWLLVGVVEELMS